MSVIDSGLRFSQCSPMVTHDEIRDELLRRLEAKEFSGKAIADLLGIAPSRVTEIKNGKRQIQQDEMVTLAKFFGLGEVDQPDVDSSVIWVPVIGIASAGAWREAVAFPAYTIPRVRSHGGEKLFAVEVQGDSMDKMIADGGVAIINPEETRLFDGKVYLISNHEFDATIKRYRVNPARFEPVSHNPSHQPIYADEHHISVIGRVLGAWSDQGF